MTSLTNSERAAWDALLEAARLQMERPKREPRDFVRAAKAAAKVRVPTGKLDRDDPFCRLVFLSLGFGDMTPPERIAQADCLADLHARCRAYLDGLDLTAERQAARRVRADIDG